MIPWEEASIYHSLENKVFMMKVDQLFDILATAKETISGPLVLLWIMWHLYLLALARENYIKGRRKLIAETCGRREGRY